MVQTVLGPAGTGGTARLASRVRGSLRESTDTDLQSMVELLAAQLDAPLVALAVLEDDVYHYEVAAGLEPFSNPAPKALCQFATGTEVLEIRDTLSDDRTCGLAAVDGREASVRYYLSMPIVVASHEVGRFCVFDMKPRELDPHAHESLRVLADAAGKLIERRLDRHGGERSAAHAAGSEPEDLVARAAHDLRSPLSTLAASLELILDSTEPEPGSITELLIGKAQGAVGRMNELVMGVLSLHSLDREFAPRAVDARAVACSVRDDLADQLSQTGGTIEVGDIGEVWADAGQLYSLFLNLVGNALKFSRPGEPPHVTISAVPSRSGKRISVTDRGVGIPVEKRERVFDLFTQLGKSEGGHGIGLSTVARIVDVHGGRISVNEGPDGVGTEVVVWLPAPPASQTRRG